MLVLEAFSDNLAKELGEFQNSVRFHIKKELEPKEIHNHPPVKFLVKDCPFCEKFGNCFSK